MAFKLTNFNYRLILTAILTRSLILRVFILHEILSRVNREELSAGCCSNKQPANTKVIWGSLRPCQYLARKMWTAQTSGKIEPFLFQFIEIRLRSTLH